MRIAKNMLSTALLMPAAVASAQDTQGVKAPNVVPITEDLVTAGQPSAESLAELSKFGFKAVIYLAPPTVRDAVASEPEILRNQGLAFVNIPIQWTKPTEADFQAFVEAMRRFRGQKVLVHCQANMRASAMTFLYRVIAAKEDPARAYDSVLKVWTPKDQWKAFMNSQLQKAKVPFEIK